MTLPPQCEIFVEFAKLGLMICISLGIIFLRHLFFSIRRKETLRETVKKAGRKTRSSFLCLRSMCASSFRDASALTWKGTSAGTSKRYKAPVDNQALR